LRAPISSANAAKLFRAKKEGGPQGRPLVSNSGAQLVAEVRVVHGVMFLTFAFLVLLMFFGARSVFTNKVARPAMLFIGVAMHMPFNAIAIAFDFLRVFVTLVMLLGIIVESDLTCIRGGDEAAGRRRWHIGPTWDGERGERHADQSASEYFSDFHRVISKVDLGSTPLSPRDEMDRPDSQIAKLDHAETR
jgi:hypothetical protein